MKAVVLMELGTLSNQSVDVPDVKNGKFVQRELKQSRGEARGGVLGCP